MTDADTPPPGIAIHGRITLTRSDGESLPLYLVGVLTAREPELFPSERPPTVSKQERRVKNAQRGGR